MKKHLRSGIVALALIGGGLVFWAWASDGDQLELVDPVEAAGVDYFGGLRQKLVGFRTLYLHVGHSGWDQLVAPGLSEFTTRVKGQAFMVYVDAERRITADALTRPPGRHFWDGRRLTFHDNEGNPKTVPAASVFLRPFLDDAWQGFPGATVSPIDPASFGITRAQQRRGATSWFQMHSEERWARGLTILLLFANHSGDLRAVVVRGEGVPYNESVGGFQVEIIEMAADVPIPVWDVKTSQMRDQDWFRPEAPDSLEWCRPEGYLVQNPCRPPHHEGRPNASIPVPQ